MNLIHVVICIFYKQKLVLMNKDVLVALRTNFDRPEHMKEWAKRLQRKLEHKFGYRSMVYFFLFISSEVDNLLQRMTIVGVILCFRQLGQEALNDVLNQRVPFLLSSIIDFKEHFSEDESDATVKNFHSMKPFFRMYHAHIFVSGGE